MICSFQHKGLAEFFRTGSVRGIQPAHAQKLQFVLSRAVESKDMDLPGFRLHSLKGQQRGFWSVRINANWRVVFRFAQDGVELVDYLDYH